mmetsp:Transcript_22604/g.76372  ORF Transcript_22604/g.76372 Transcript_22604/m.76372 type:complete len:279 (-) Transcript_22604:1151-1987(-)
METSKTGTVSRGAPQHRSTAHKSRSPKSASGFDCARSCARRSAAAGPRTSSRTRRWPTLARLTSRPRIGSLKSEAAFWSDSVAAAPEVKTNVATSPPRVAGENGHSSKASVEAGPSSSARTAKAVRIVSTSPFRSETRSQASSEAAFQARGSAWRSVSHRRNAFAERRSRRAQSSLSESSEASEASSDESSFFFFRLRFGFAGFFFFFLAFASAFASSSASPRRFAWCLLKMLTSAASPFCAANCGGVRPCELAARSRSGALRSKISTTVGLELVTAK